MNVFVDIELFIKVYTLILFSGSIQFLGYPQNTYIHYIKLILKGLREHFKQNYFGEQIC